jgi:hypothetical protein
MDSKRKEFKTGHLSKEQTLMLDRIIETFQEIV